MRIFIVIFMAVMMVCIGGSGCGGASNPAADKSINEKSILGQWNIVNKMQSADIERITKINGAKSTGGYFIFKADKTYEFLFNVTTSGDIFDSRASGTYKLENDVLSLTDQSNKTKRSSLKFEGDYLVVKSLESDVDPAFLIYLKHTN